MTAEDTVNRVFREFKRYTGDGLPNEPAGADLPIGDPQSGPHSPKKSEIRTAILEAVIEAEAWASAASATAIPDGSLATAKYADSSVTAAKLGAGAVTETKLATDAVTQSKIADGAVVFEHFSPDFLAPTTVAADLQGYGWYIGATSGSFDPAEFGAGTILTNLHTGQLNVLHDSRHLRGIFGGYDCQITGGNPANLLGGVSTGVDGGEACWIFGSHHSDIIGQSTHGVAVGGSTLIIDGHYSSIFGGSLNTIVGDYAFVAGLQNSVLTSTAGWISGGRANQVTADYAGAYGRDALAHLQYSVAQGGVKRSTQGDRQRVDVVRGAETTSATPAGVTLVLRNNTAWTFRFLVTAKRVDSGLESAGYYVRGLIHRGGSAGTTAMVASSVSVIGESDTTWDCTVAASTGAGGLTFTLTGASGKTVNWTIEGEISEAG